MKQVARDVVGELLETGKQAVKQGASVPKQVAKTAVGKTDNKKTGEKTTGNKGVLPPPQPDLEKISVQTSGVNQQYIQMVQADNKKRQEGVDRVRQQLAQMKIKRYKEIQQEIQKARKKREGDIPEYIAGKPGAPRTHEEKLKMQEKQVKEARKKQDGVEMPKGPRPRGSLFFAKQRKGSGETKLGKQG